MSPKRRLKAFIRRPLAPLPPDARVRAELDGRSIVDAGIDSYASLCLVDEQRLSDPDLRAFAYWLLARDPTPRGRAGTAPRRHRSRVGCALRGLGGLAGVDLPEAVERLAFALMNDPYPTARVIAALALGDHEESTLLVRMMCDSNQPPVVRGAAAEALAHTGGDVDPILRAALGDPEPDVRLNAAFALGQRHDRSALPQLRDLAANDPGVVVGVGTVREFASDAVRNIERAAE